MLKAALGLARRRVPGGIIGPMETATASALPPSPGPGVGPVVAIDGPVASGKSTVGQAAARRLGLAFLDTGLMYRALTWLALRRGFSAGIAGGCADADGIVNLADRFPVEIVEGDGIAIAGCRPGGELHSPAVNRNVSAVSAISGVRRALVARQRAIAGDSAGGIIMAGRDIGTVVLPDASIKLYIDAAPETRARRRLAQMYPDDASAVADHYDRILADTIRRDGLDSRRADSPLRIPDGATVINTDQLGFDATVAAVIDTILAAVRPR